MALEQATGEGEAVQASFGLISAGEYGLTGQGELSKLWCAKKGLLSSYGRKC
jgi:hypothetical protein